MFDDMADQIDAVFVATPDHTHAVITMAAFKRGKHVYCEKPLAWSLDETRRVTEAARQAKGREMLKREMAASDARAFQAASSRAPA